MSGIVGDLSPQQADALNKFRENVKDVLKPDQGDYFLLRWLRARNFDVKKAEKMLRDALRWRQEIGADTILKDYQPLEVIEKYRTGGVLGRDKEGCPIYIDPYGLVDMKGLLRSVKKYDILRKFTHVMESVRKLCEEESEKQGRHIEQLTVIYDLNQVGLKHTWKPVQGIDSKLPIPRHLAPKGHPLCTLFGYDCQETMSILTSVDMYLAIVDAAESRYPEVLRRVFVINSPKIFPIIWSIVRPLLHENTAKKIVVLTGNYTEALLKEISPDNLPACYGGTLTDPDGDPRCRTHICQGGPIPKEYYNQSVPHHAMVTGNIGRGSTLQLEYEVHEPNSVLRYEFQTDGYDIGFGVFRKKSKERLKASEMDTILTTQRSNCHLVPEDGAVECDLPGIYVVRFDNTYSWARSKKVYYLIEILEPESKSTASKNSNSDDDDEEEFVMAEDKLS